MTSKVTFDALLEGEIEVSLINQPIDYGVDYTVEPLAIARQRWRCDPELITGDQRSE